MKDLPSRVVLPFVIRRWRSRKPPLGKNAMLDARHVYIVPTDLIPKAEKAMSEMFDSNLHGFPMDETTRMVIEYEGKRREAIAG